MVFEPGNLTLGLVKDEVYQVVIHDKYGTVVYVLYMKGVFLEDGLDWAEYLHSK